MPSLSKGPPDALTRALTHGQLSEARYALERARSLFELARVRAEFGRVEAPSPHAATPILRDLALRLDLLRPPERARAAAFFARPANTDVVCDPDRPLCFHRTVGGTRHATSNADFEATIATFREVWDLEVDQYGYLPPLPDGNRDGSDATDIYLRDLGGNAAPLFGYCTTDDPDAGFSPFSDAWAYCVLDNDFSEEQFGDSQEPEEFRAVTAAHEFFHAVQFAYDWREDLWLMEGTAMFMEGAFRPAVRDRIHYLENSILESPRTPVDRGADGFEYGAWIYWRFLAESFGELLDPIVIREIWERTAGASTDTDGAGPDTLASNPYSLAATKRVLASRGAPFRPLFAQFTQANRAPTAFYDEGAFYPRTPASQRRTMGPAENSGWRSTTLRHLASVSYAFKPGAGIGRTAELRLVVNLPKRAYGPAAGALVRHENGMVDFVEIPLDADGAGVVMVPFGGPSIGRVDLVLTNASARMSCDRGTSYSCRGLGRDDDRTYSYRAVVPS